MSEKVLRNAVLVIDDDADFRGLVETFAELWNVPVLQAGDCNSGLRILDREHQRIKMILLDYFIPGMEPVKCAKAILTKAGSSISVVLVTAAVDAGARAGELKITRWMTKPFDSSVLRRLLTDGESKPGTNL
jgi:DNA-binding response OmpR family regulator